MTQTGAGAAAGIAPTRALPRLLLRAARHRTCQRIFARLNYRLRQYLHPDRPRPAVGGGADAIPACEDTGRSPPRLSGHIAERRPGWGPHAELAGPACTSDPWTREPLDIGSPGASLCCILFVLGLFYFSRPRPARRVVPSLQPRSYTTSVSETPASSRTASTTYCTSIQGQQARSAGIGCGRAFGIVGSCC